MPDLEVIYDSAKEMACIVNVDTRQGWGPAMIGPNAGDVLQTFVTMMPFDVSLLTSEQATEVFGGWLEAAFQAAPEETATPDQGTVEQPSPMAVGDDTALAEAEAANATITPEPAPADTDTDAETTPTVQVANCFNCGGNGRIEFGDGSEPQRCNMCQGTGRIAVQV